MKVLESQNAVLTNFEVYQHLLNEQWKFKQPDRKRKVPRAVQNLIKDVRFSLSYHSRMGMFVVLDIDMLSQVIEYLRTSPNPFGQNPITYDGFTIGRLVTRLSGYELTKGETIMILNVRPENAAILSTCIEDFMIRFTEDQQNEIQAIIEEVLGPFPERQEEPEADEGA